MTHQIDEQQEQALVEAFRPFAALSQTLANRVADEAELWSAFKVDALTGAELQDKAFLHARDLRRAASVLLAYESGDAALGEIVSAARVFVGMAETFAETQQYEQQLYAAEAVDPQTGRWSGQMVVVTLGQGRMLQRHVNLFDTGEWLNTVTAPLTAPDNSAAMAELAETVWPFLEPRIRGLISLALQAEDEPQTTSVRLEGGLL